MKVRKEWIGSKKPATQGNLADVQEDIHADLQPFATKQDIKDELVKYATKEDLGKVESRLDKRIGRVERIVESILKVVQSIEGRFKDLANFEKVPERLTKVENDVFKLKLRR